MDFSNIPIYNQTPASITATITDATGAASSFVLAPGSMVEFQLTDTVGPWALSALASDELGNNYATPPVSVVGLAPIYISLSVGLVASPSQPEIPPA